jgi:mRNA interferase HicA
MRGNEFLRRIRRLRKKGMQIEWRPDLGKGSHGVLRVNDKFTVLRNLKDELKTGTLMAMLKQLGLKKEDLE